MVEKIIGSLSALIREKWGDEYKVYTEGVYQGAEKPCFFVDCESVEQAKLLGERFYLKVTVKITVENDNELKKYEGQKMIGDFFALMNSIQVGNITLYGRKICSEWKNGKWVIRGCYNIFPALENEENVALMETIEGKQEI